MFFEQKLLYRKKGEVPDEEYIVELGKADVKREGKDLTIITYGRMVPTCLAVAENLAKEGIEVEVVDPRTLLPLDTETLAASVKKTGRVLIVHEAVKTGGFGGEIAAAIADSEAFYYLDAPIKRLCGLDVPIPLLPGTREERGTDRREDNRSSKDSSKIRRERMATAIIMPKAGMAMEEGTIMKWLKAEGQQVEQGEPLLEILTDKVVMEVEAQVSGTLIKILKEEGEVVPVTKIIGYLGEAGEKAPEAEEIKGTAETAEHRKPPLQELRQPKEKRQKRKKLQTQKQQLNQR